MPSLDDLPVEILTKIASYLVVNEIVFPSDKVEIEYDPNDGGKEKGEYWSLGKSLVRRHYGLGLQYHHTTPSGQYTSLLNLAKASKRLLPPAEECIYRHTIVRDRFSEQICNLLTTLASSKSHLQPRMKALMVKYTSEPLRGEVLGTKEWQQGVQKNLIPGMRNMATLRCLDLKRSPQNRDFHFEEWYKVLPQLPALRKLSLRHFDRLDWQFPELPQVQEAHFYSCQTNALPGGMCEALNTTPRDIGRSGVVSIFQKLPALQTLIVAASFFWGVPEEAFEPFENTLETLAWMDARRDSGCQQPIRRLKNLKHLKVDNVDHLMSEEFEHSVPGNLACTMDTIELALNNAGLPNQDFWYFGLFRSESELDFLENLLNALERTCQYSCAKLRVIDIRCYTPEHLDEVIDLENEHGDFETRNWVEDLLDTSQLRLEDCERWNRAREMLDASRFRLEGMGVRLLHDQLEIPVDRYASESDEDDGEIVDEQYGSATGYDTWGPYQGTGHTLGENEPGNNSERDPYV